MRSFITFNEIRAMNAGKFQKSLAEAAYKRSCKGSTFLSHSSKDDEFLPSIIGILEIHGANVYVDKKDPNLSDIPNLDAAKCLRENIAECRKFILFVTPNTKDSKWIPWELGFADGDKRSAKVALFPSAESENDQEWSEREYLGLYDRIIWGNFRDKESEWLVLNNRDNTAIRLREWLGAG